MNQELTFKIKNDPKMYELLKKNSYWIKRLYRNPNEYKNFVNDMKVKYHMRVTDKVNDAIDGIGIISAVIDTLK